MSRRAILALLTVVIAVGALALAVLTDMPSRMNGVASHDAMGSYAHLDDDRLSSEADIIVIGTVGDVGAAFKGARIGKVIRARMEADGLSPAEVEANQTDATQQIFTPYVIRVDDAIKGADGLPNVAMDVRGGTFETQTVEYDGLEPLLPGTKVLAFLQETYEGVHEPIGVYVIAGSKARGVSGANRETRDLEAFKKAITARVR